MGQIITVLFSQKPLNICHQMRIVSLSASACRTGAQQSLLFPDSCCSWEDVNSGSSCLFCPSYHPPSQASFLLSFVDPTFFQDFFLLFWRETKSRIFFKEVSSSVAFIFGSFAVTWKSGLYCQQLLVSVSFPTFSQISKLLSCLLIVTKGDEQVS